MYLGLVVSAIVYYANDKKLNENQKDPKLHYFIFDHFLFRWLPDGFRKWARFGLINPELEPVRDPRATDQSTVLSKKFCPGSINYGSLASTQVCRSLLRRGRTSLWNKKWWFSWRERSWPWSWGEWRSQRWIWRRPWTEVFGTRRKKWVIQGRQWRHISIKIHGKQSSLGF